jgi:DNA-binding XRE family transcriptional regulator
VQELRIARSRAGMTLMELEAASGVGASTISKIERGVSQPQAATLRKLADALGVEVDELYPKARPRKVWEYDALEYDTLLGELGFPREQIKAWRKQNELEQMSAKDFLEALMASQHGEGASRIRDYYRANDPRADKAPRSESA